MKHRLVCEKQYQLRDGEVQHEEGSNDARRAQRLAGATLTGPSNIDLYHLASLFLIKEGARFLTHNALTMK